MFYVFLYLAAIVAANLSVAHFGPSSSVINAFLFIGLDLTARDGLHDRWQHRNLWRKMTMLIGAGSALSWLVNHNAGRIAAASFVSFAMAGAADALLYHRLRERPRLERVNGSNLLSAFVDSLAFPVLAFGWPPMLWICAGQFVAKFCGGLLWSWLLFRGGARQR